MTLRLSPVQHSGIRGTVVLWAAGKARTDATVTIVHLPPHADPWAGLKSGSCSDLHHISSSTIILPTPREEAAGTARGTGRAHGTWAGGFNVPFGEFLHPKGMIALVSTRAGWHGIPWVACGNVP